ncbi:DUF1376 domain-containing protein [Brucella intermedia]|uniref:DUF1376 domain-containing protein n=1 Tax=Brucella intermedia TaxID=94625 RepID=UPI00178C73E8|nr:DUF1376 domain-containing protein [Brucella intermedia]
MNGLPYYKAYPRDFIEGTIGMPFELKAAYRLVLDLIYMQGGNLPDDARYISGLLGCTLRKWNSLRGELIAMGKIEINGEFLTNKRAVIELETTRKFTEKQAENRSKPNKNNGLKSPPCDHTDTDTDNTSSLRSDVKAQAPEKPSVKSELMKVVDEDHAQAVIEHRKAIKKPMTVRAAQLLAGKFAKCQNPNAAVDMMISSGWQGFEPEWLENRKSSTRREPPPKRGETATDIWADELRERGILRDEPDSYASDLLDVGDGGRYFEGNVRPLRVAFSGSK